MGAGASTADAAHVDRCPGTALRSDVPRRLGPSPEPDATGPMSSCHRALGSRDMRRRRTPDASRRERGHRGSSPALHRSFAVTRPLSAPPGRPTIRWYGSISCAHRRVPPLSPCQATVVRLRIESRGLWIDNHGHKSGFQPCVHAVMPPAVAGGGSSSCTAASRRFGLYTGPGQARSAPKSLAYQCKGAALCLSDPTWRRPRASER
jgi:hypothetical protein